MSIRKYIAYLRTVETGSITQAANELGYTQSAVILSRTGRSSS